jgi:hypothetical protein
MSDHPSYQANPETQGTVPVQFFEADGRAPPAGTKATPRPADRPRELPPSGPSSTSMQVFQSQESSLVQPTTAMSRPADRRPGAD